MSLSSYSLVFSTPTKQGAGVTCSPSLLHKIYDQNVVHTAQRIRVTSHITSSASLSVNESPNVLGRRELIATGVNLGVLAGGLLQTRSADAEPIDGACEFTVSPSGLAFCDQVVGTGLQAAKGQLIKAHYVGKLENGKVFDSSYSRGKPLTFRVGVGEVIRGWDQGILGTDDIPAMVAGGKRKLRIPPELAYGNRGAGCRGGTCIIPPNSLLFFDVEFVGKA